MTAWNFRRALRHVLHDEGGYVDHPQDPGGATNMGVTRATLSRWRDRHVSKREVRALTQHEAGRIYRRFYWDRVAGDALPSGVDYAVFDAAVHSGPSRAARWLQTIVGAKADGVIGPRTLARLGSHRPDDLVRRLCARRLAFMKSLRGWAVFGRGWTARMNRVERAALAMVGTADPIRDNARGSTTMNDTKKWYQSTTVWAAVVTLLATLGGMVGVELGADAQVALAELLPQLIASAGAVVALLGRLTARSALR